MSVRVLMCRRQVQLVVRKCAGPQLGKNLIACCLIFVRIKNVDQRYMEAVVFGYSMNRIQLREKQRCAAERTINMPLRALG